MHDVCSQYQQLQSGKTELSHDGLNPAHVPYWRANNLTLFVSVASLEDSCIAIRAWTSGLQSKSVTLFRWDI